MTSHNIEIKCNDPVVEAALRQWLDDSRMEWPEPLYFDLQVIPELPGSNDPRPIFTQPGVSIQAGPPESFVRIRSGVTPAEALIAPRSPRVRITMTPAAAERMDAFLRGFMVTTLLFMLRRVSWFHVHSAALVDPDGRGWHLVGESESGKSTTTALLATQGWGVATDDIAFLQNDGGRVTVRGFRSRIALRPGGYDLLARAGGEPLVARGKTGFFPEELGARWVDRVVPEKILYTSVGTGGPTTARPMRPREVIQELMQWSMWILFEPERAQEHLDLLAALGRGAANYRVVLGPDLFQDPTLLMRLTS